MKAYRFELEMKVRDYECDLQGVVNNANYQHYMEHTRHEFLESLGENFGRLHDQGVDVFVSRVDIKYRQSLRSGDRFRSCMNLVREAVVITARVEAVAVEGGHLTRGEYFDRLLTE